MERAAVEGAGKLGKKARKVQQAQQHKGAVRENRSGEEAVKVKAGRKGAGQVRGHGVHCGGGGGLEEAV